MENELTVKLPYSQEEFAIPPNLYVIGTMNTADKSIALIDVALRRRFGFMEMSPDFGVLRKEHIEKNSEALKNEGVYDGLEKSIDALEIINNRIAADPSVGRDRQIGHSFLFKVQTQSDLILVWKNEILPLLEEYYYGQYSRINELLFQKADDTSWLSQNEGIKDFAEYEDLNAFLDEVNSNE
jgi:5-methylcytosine-specific restriction protein B